MKNQKKGKIMRKDYFIGKQAFVKFENIVAIDIASIKDGKKAEVILKNRTVMMYGQEVDELTQAFLKYMNAKCRYRAVMFWLRIALLIIMGLIIYIQVK